jgi:hypothetical protein
LAEQFQILESVAIRTVYYAQIKYGMHAGIDVPSLLCFMMYCYAGCPVSKLQGDSDDEMEKI